MQPCTAAQLDAHRARGHQQVVVGALLRAPPGSLRDREVRRRRHEAAPLPAHLAGQQWGVRGSGVENSAKKDKSGQTGDPQLGREKNTVILVFRS